MKVILLKGVVITQIKNLLRKGKIWSHSETMIVIVMTYYERKNYHYYIFIFLIRVACNISNFFFSIFFNLSSLHTYVSTFLRNPLFIHLYYFLSIRSGSVFRVFGTNIWTRDYSLIF